MTKLARNVTICVSRVHFKKFGNEFRIWRKQDLNVNSSFFSGITHVSMKW